MDAPNPQEDCEELWEEEEEEAALDQTEGTGRKRKHPREWYTEQSRSYYALVRRKFQGETILHWLAEVRKPPEIKNIQDDRKTREGLIKGLITPQEVERGKKLTVHGCIDLHHRFKTDVEAAVAGCVIALVYEDFVRERRNLSHADPLVISKPFPGCEYLIDRRMQQPGARWPDATQNQQVRALACDCTKDFVKIAQDVRDGKMEMPESDIRIAIDAYIHKAWFYTRLYEKHEIPSLKQKGFRNPQANKPKVMQKKKREVTSIQLECCCDSHPHPKTITWKIHDLCLCGNLNNFRLTHL